MKVPKYIQLCIKRMLYHRKVVENNTRIVNSYFQVNNIKSNIPLISLIDKNIIKKEKVPKGQISIYDLLEKEEENNDVYN